MRHNRKINHLGRQSSHRKAMMANMATSLILHKRIKTTLAKAKALRMYVEPIINKSKEDITHHRRITFSYLKSKEAVTELFRVVAPKVADRPGGYTRILKLGFRQGDAAEMCFIELVDFNDTYTPEKKTAAKKSRTRRAGSAKKAEITPIAEAKETKEETKIVESLVEEVPTKEEFAVEEVIEETALAAEESAQVEKIPTAEPAEKEKIAEEAKAE